MRTSRKLEVYIYSTIEKPVTHGGKARLTCLKNWSKMLHSHRFHTQRLVNTWTYKTFRKLSMCGATYFPLPYLKSTSSALLSHFYYMQTTLLFTQIRERNQDRNSFLMNVHTLRPKTHSAHYVNTIQIAVRYQTLKLTSRPICPMLSGVVAAAADVTVPAAPPTEGSATGMLMS